jgi:hypothetical protein
MWPIDTAANNFQYAMVVKNKERMQTNQQTRGVPHLFCIKGTASAVQEISCYEHFIRLGSTLRFGYHLANLSLSPCQWEISWSWPNSKEILRLKILLSGLFLFKLCTSH